MKEPSLQKTTVLSLAIHISVLFIALLLLRQSNKFIMPSPYVVSLVSPAALKGKSMDIRKSQETSKPLKDTSVVETVSKQELKKKEKMIEERIAAIAAKKKVERLVKLRSEISLKASSNTSKDGSATSAQIGKESLFDQYYTKIRKEIWQQWAFPDFGQKDLEAIIAIRIMKDGTVSIQNIEKSSGNAFFDKSAIKAITKASPLPPPPYEMEIGVRFYP